VFLGRIEPIKGTHNAVKAAQLTGRKLLIAGNIASEHKSYYDKQIRPHLSNRIEYIGPVNDVEKNKLLGSACSFLMPIEWNEPFGIVMAEAMACGTPVIGYPLGAVPEIVTNNFNGFLANDIGGMVEALRKIETIDRSNCRKTVEDRFSADKIIGNYLSVYHQIMKGA
jgi:glycosyltransferase involved in cell wall biosynthesis